MTNTAAMKPIVVGVDGSDALVRGCAVRAVLAWETETATDSVWSPAGLPEQSTSPGDVVEVAR